ALVRRPGGHRPGQDATGERRPFHHGDGEPHPADKSHSASTRHTLARFEGRRDHTFRSAPPRTLDGREGPFLQLPVDRNLDPLPGFFEEDDALLHIVSILT